VQAIEELAREKRVAPAQLALAWVVARYDHIVPIPGTRSIERLEENAAALELRLTPSELGRLDAIAPRDVAAGSRYPTGGMAAVGR
jgi:aryl-alcohol dehydrogenase-like predicted oxidoreductase